MKKSSNQSNKQGDSRRKFPAEQVKQELGPGTYIKYSDMTLWDSPGEGGPDLYIFAPAITEDELLALEEEAASSRPSNKE